MRCTKCGQYGVNKRTCPHDQRGGGNSNLTLRQIEFIEKAANPDPVLVEELDLDPIDLLFEDYPDWDDANVAPKWLRAAALAYAIMSSVDPNRSINRAYAKVNKNRISPLGKDIISMTESLMNDLTLDDLYYIGI